jgi:HlyD family secretion protein
MKRIIILSIFSMIIFISCQENGNKADAYGNFEATEVIVSSQASGQILKFTPEEGEVLKLNEVVGLIDTVNLQLNRRLLEQQKVTIASQFNNVNSEIDVLNQQLKNAKINQKRIHNLFKSGAATQKQVDDIDGAIDLILKQISSAKTRLQNIADQIKGIDVQIDQVDEALSKCIITNPQQGTVLVKYSEAGEVAGVGKPLYKIADLTEMKLKAYVSGAQLPNIKLGQEVEVQFDKTKKENTSKSGVVSWISSTAEFTPKTIQTKEERVNLVYAIKVTVKNDGTIKIGMPGELYFTNN